MSKTDPLPTPTSDVPSLPARAPETHKGQAGRVAIIAGSRGMSGAAVLAGMGALRGGAGLVRIYCPASVQPVIAASEPCFMTVPLAECDRGRIAVPPEELTPQLEGWASVLTLGPGLGLSEPLAEFVWGVLEQATCPVVLDADGLNNVAGYPRAKLQSFGDHATVVTPHPGEMARLRKAAGLPAAAGGDDATRLRAACELARHSSDTTVVLKGHRTIVADGTRAYVNTTGNPGMATGGMGDVLTGLIAALLAQGLEPFDAARLGVHVHGLAADRLAEQVGPIGYLAREVADAIPAVLAQSSRARLGFR